MNLAFLGLGNMGAAMARNLQRAGHTSPSGTALFPRLTSFATKERKSLSSVAEAARGADIVITMMADDHAVVLGRVRSRRHPGKPRARRYPHLHEHH